MSLTHDTPPAAAAQRGPNILVAGTFGIPYYRAADWPDAVAVADLNAQQRACLMQELAAWLTEATTAATALAEELSGAEIVA
jgi:hypothetical protein